jgi:hypothetical protein
MADTHRVWKGDSETSIDQTNQWMRAQPWYQQQLQQWGQDPGHPTLSKDQSHQLVRLAQANGAVVDEGNIEVDNHGNFNPIGHKMRNALIAAGVAGAALTGGAALGAFGGAGAAGGAGASAAGAGASAVPALGGGATLAANLGGAGALAGLGGGAGAAAGGGVLGTLGTIGRHAQTLSDLGNGLSQGAAGMASGRRDDNNADMYAASANNRARLDAAEFNMGAPVTRAQQVAKGDLMAANIPQSQSTGSGRDVSFSGGIGPQYFGADTTQAGNEMKRQALMALMSGSDKLEPQITQPRRAGVGENIMAGAGMGANVLGTLGRIGRRF